MKKAVFYLCDGTVEDCPQTSYYKKGHECHHTNDVTHALNLEPRNFVSNDQGNLWEASPEN